MTLKSKRDWIYCRVIDRGRFSFPRSSFWFGNFEFASNLGADVNCMDALRESMAANAMSDSGSGWGRMTTARTVMMDETADDARHNGAATLLETVRIFNAYVSMLAPLEIRSPGYLYDIQTRSATPLLPPPPEYNPIGQVMMTDDVAHHPQHVLTMLLVSSAERWGELAMAFRRSTHWRELALGAQDESERLLLHWMAAECLTKTDHDDAVGPRLLAAVGLPTALCNPLSGADASVLRSPNVRFERKRLVAIVDQLRAARNEIVHRGYRKVDLISILPEESISFANELLPIATQSLNEAALVALDLGLRSVSEMWQAYPRILGPGGVAARASWFLGRVDESTNRRRASRLGCQ